MIRLLKTGLLALLSVIMIAGIVLYIFRNPLLHALIDGQLNKQGLPLQSLTVEEFSFNTLRLHDLAAGKNKELRIGKILLNWTFSDLIAGKPISIEISGLQAMLDLSGIPSAINPRKSVAAPSGTNISIPWLSVFSLQDSVIHLHSTAGNATVALSGNIIEEQSGAYAVRFSAIVSGAPAQAQGILAATVDAQGNGQGKLTISEGMLNLPEAKISGFAGEATAIFAALQPQHIQTELKLSGIKLPGKESETPQPDKNQAISTLRDTAIDHFALKADIRGLADSWTGTLDLKADGGQLSAASWHIQQLFVSLPMQIAFAQNNWRIGLRNPGQITLGKIEPGYPLRFQNAPAFSIPQADLALVKKPQGWELKQNIAVVPANLTVFAKREDSTEVEARLHPGKIIFSGKLDGQNDQTEYRGQLAINDAALQLPQSHLQVKDISAILHINDAEIGHAADFAIGQLQHLASEPLFAALSVSGSIRNQAADGKPPVYALNVSGGIPELRYLKITGSHALESGDGMLKAEIVPLSFSPSGLQPGVLSPILAQLEDVSGQVNAAAQFKWSAQGVRNSRGMFAMHNLSFTRETAKISDLNVALTLDDLLTLSSAPRQSVTIRRVDVGVPLENVLVSYHIQAADPPRIALEKAQFSLMDGTVSVVPTIIDPAAARTDMLIRVNNIDLEAFFNLIKVDGLAGSGHLDGQIPLTLEHDHVTITNGHLAAKAPGKLHFKSEKAAQMLASAGKEMDLLLQAMQDFHYSELTFDLDKSVKHDLVAKLSLLGNNPNVKDGRAFRLNIKLETDIDKILQTINQGYSLSHEILRGSFRLR